MANELVIHYLTGATLYALLHDATGQIWNGAAFAAPGSANWTDYDIAMSEVATATGIYRGTMPGAAAGVYGFVVRRQAGASPAVTDIVVGAGSIEWNGTAEVPLSEVATTAGSLAGDISSILNYMQAYVSGDDGFVIVSPASVFTALPAVAPGTAGGLPILGANETGMSFADQVKITADNGSEGALHVDNTNAGGIGVFVNGGGIGVYNQGGTYGVQNYGATAAVSPESELSAAALAAINAEVDTALVNGVTLADAAITAAKFDGATAYPLTAEDAGATAVGRVGTDTVNTLTTLSDQADNRVGYKLASDGLDAISIADPAGVATNFREMIVQLWRRFFKKQTMTAAQLKLYADNDSTVLVTQAVSDDGTTQTIGKAT